MGHAGCMKTTCVEVQLMELRERLGRMLRRVAREKAPLVITRWGRPIARILPVEDAPADEPKFNPFYGEVAR